MVGGKGELRAGLRHEVAGGGPLRHLVGGRHRGGRRQHHEHPFLASTSPRFLQYPHAQPTIAPNTVMADNWIIIEAAGIR